VGLAGLLLASVIAVAMSNASGRIEFAGGFERAGFFRVCGESPRMLRAFFADFTWDDAGRGDWC